VLAFICAILRVTGGIRSARTWLPSPFSRVPMMADEELFALARQGRTAWNAWRDRNFFVPAAVLVAIYTRCPPNPI
jgi:hypothetical protein